MVPFSGNVPKKNISFLGQNWARIKKLLIGGNSEHVIVLSSAPERCMNLRQIYVATNRELYCHLLANGGAFFPLDSSHTN